MLSITQSHEVFNTQIKMIENTLRALDDQITHLNLSINDMNQENNELNDSFAISINVFKNKVNQQILNILDRINSIYYPRYH